MLEGLRDAERRPSIVMEPTGTYGDAHRYPCAERGLPVHMMPPKHTHDFAEVLDGVPSMHDPQGRRGAGKASGHQARTRMATGKRRGEISARGSSSARRLGAP